MAGTRMLARILAAATSAAALVALAGPAEATYTAVPISLAWHPAGAVHSSVFGNGVVYVGGKLDGTGGIAAVDPGTGELLWSVPANGDVRALALSPDGSTLYAGGGFTTVNGALHRHVVAVDTGNHNVLASWKGAAEGTVRDLVVQGDDVYVAGKLTSVGGVAQRGIGALDSGTGKRDAAFDFSADNDVLGLALTGSQLILSGSFSQINGVARSELASIDLSTNTLTSWAPAKLCSSCDQYWDVQTDGTNAYVATSGNSAAAFTLSTGAKAWPTIRGTGDFQAVWLPGDGRVYFGGHFGAGVWSSGSPQNQVDAKMLVAVFTASGTIDSGWTPRLFTSYPGVWTFTSSAHDLWVGGDFTGEQVNGSDNHKPYLAAYPDGIADTQPPTGTFATDTVTAWAGVTKVRVVQSALHDNVTPDNRIDRSVDWGDGTTTSWTTGTTLSHVYASAGSFNPQVTLTDEAGNASAPIGAGTVKVKVDAAAPVVTLRLPGHRHSVDAWRTLRGTATDSPGTGVTGVSVRVVEKRGTTWYAYNAATKSWVKAATKAKAFQHSGAFSRNTHAHHRWSATLASLHRGTLVYKVSATDVAGNVSQPLTHKATLTTP